jgi:hypothetical protein
MNFKINKITSSMSHDQKVFEYARRISFYHLMMTEERSMSKIFACSNLKRNAIDNSCEVGCLKRPDLEPCDSCSDSAKHYVFFRRYNKLKATAMRQLNKELVSSNINYKEYEDLSLLIEAKNNEDY